MTGEVLGLPGGGTEAGTPARSRYRTVALGALAAADGLAVGLLPVLAPEMSRSLGVSRTLLSFVVVVGSLLAALAGMGFAAACLRRADRAVTSVVAAAVVAGATVACGWVNGAGGLLVAHLLVLGLARGAVLALHRPLVFDGARPGHRLRALCSYRAAGFAGAAVLPAAVAGVAGAAGLTWRAAFVLGGVLAALATTIAVRLGDPGRAPAESEALSRLVGTTEPEEPPRFAEAVRRVLLVPTFRRVLVVWAVVGILSFPLASFVSFLLDERFDVGPEGRLAILAAGGVTGAAALLVLGRHGTRRLRDHPSALLGFAAAGLSAMGAALLVTAAAPALPLASVAVVAAFVLLALVVAALDAVTLTMTEPRLRVVAAALAGVFVVGLGTVSGVLLLGGLDRRFGVRWAVACLALPALAGALAARRAGRGAGADVDRLAEREVARGELRARAARGEKAPLLACRGIDFSYGPLQVLFDVGFTVDDGERVALLGTNGAGKSTLLRVISGLGFPQRGSVHYRGEDVTFLDAERRVVAGITQISGGRAVFGPMTVVDNLRVFGYTSGRSRRRVDAGLDAVFDAFPRLAERRDQPAATLSGGEQQMLALGKALLLEPPLLLIDELSLGLAPVVVGELLAMVERINAAGTAVVLVEQSVNIALSVVDHAYFMEKGEIRFDGPAHALLERRDLLRSVFLEGAGRAWG